MPGGDATLSHFQAVANLRSGRSSAGSTNAAVAVSIAAQKGVQPLATAKAVQPSERPLEKSTQPTLICVENHSMAADLPDKAAISMPERCLY